MHTISRDSPCYYLTSVTRDRLPIFRTDDVKIVTCKALDEARNSGKFALYAYVIIYSLWDHHPDARVLLTEKMLMERVHYTHQNPVRAGLVARAEDYRWSSVRIWNGNPLEDEPLLMNLDRIKWRSAGLRQ